MVKPLYIPEKSRWNGLTVYCNKCKTTVNKICRTTEKGIQKCPYAEKHTFKVEVHVPGTRNKRRTKILDTREIDQAVKEAIEFSKEVKQEIRQSKNGERIENKEIERDDNIPYLFIHAAAHYADSLRGENVPEHHSKHIRSVAHVKDVERAFIVFTESMQKKGYDMKTLAVDGITDEMVGVFHAHLVKEKGYGNRTYNKYIGHLTSFVKWYQEEFDAPIKNYFEKAERRDVQGSNPLSITYAEFKHLLEVATSKNGVKIYPDGRKRYLFRHYLIPAWRLGLETGRRREEIISMAFNNIIVEQDGTKFLKCEDFKVNKIKNRTKKETKKYNYVPITPSLWELLQECGYEKYKDTGTYILAPEIKNNRMQAMADSITKGFSHYYDLLGTERKLTFKSLRKTYITRLSLFMNNAKAITGHSGDEVINRHYIDKEAIAKAAKGFSVFSKDEQRLESLQHVRNSNVQKENEKEIE